MQTLNEIPDLYWHCSVEMSAASKKESPAVVNDLTLRQMRAEIVDPWCQGKRFTVAGTIVKNSDAVTKIRITRTDKPMRHYADEHDAAMIASGVADLVTDVALLPLGEGTDYTHELLFKNATGPQSITPDVALLLHLCERLPQASRVLSNRKHKKKPFLIEDEYDAQDLLHAMIRSVFKYAVTEEPIGKVGGGPSSRADIALEDLGALVELKYVRGQGDQEKMVREFAEDLMLYSQWAPLKTFIFLVVNSRDLRDPEAFERLSGENTIRDRAYRTHVVLA